MHAILNLNSEKAFGWRSVRLPPGLRERHAIFSDGPSAGTSQGETASSFPSKSAPLGIEHLQKTGGGTNTIYFKAPKKWSCIENLSTKGTPKQLSSQTRFFLVVLDPLS